jgi:CBS domain-containing protein
MPAATVSSEPQIRLQEPVRSLLHAKGPAVWSISPDATVYEALQQMAEKRVGALVVLKGGRLEGIISERDYARKVILVGKSSQDTHVREIMTAPAPSIGPEQPVDECMRMMTSERVRHLAVIERGVVVGIVSIGDLVSWIISSHEQTIHHLQSYITGAYPA